MVFSKCTSEPKAPPNGQSEQLIITICAVAAFKKMHLNAFKFNISKFGSMFCETSSLHLLPNYKSVCRSRFQPHLPQTRLLLTEFASACLCACTPEMWHLSVFDTREDPSHSPNSLKYIPTSTFILSPTDKQKKDIRGKFDGS